MAGYVKIWTDIFNDEWFISLKVIERGVWLQLIVWAKNNGDSGKIFGKNSEFFSQIFNISTKTLEKILKKFEQCGKIKLDTKDSETKGVLSIEICNYLYWQRDRDARQPGKNSEKIPENRKNSEKSQKIFPYKQSREEQSRIQIKYNSENQGGEKLVI